MNYHPFYCEENVWHLCREDRFTGRAPAAVFVSGRAGGCVMWHQRAAPRPGAALAWDYHVVLLAQDPWEIWDLDTTLGLPVPAAEYLVQSFRPDLELPAELAAVLRVVGAEELARVFASDRSHMRDARGRFRKPPPPWPAIAGTSNLARFVDMADPIAGEVLDVAALLARVTTPRGGG